MSAAAVMDLKVDTSSLCCYLCHHCFEPFDLELAPWCGCITRERTFSCPACGGCACAAPAADRNLFWVGAHASLWIRRREEQSAGARRLQSLAGADLPRPFALVVDDDPVVLRVAERALKQIGFSTLTTSNPDEAWSAASTMLPDLVLTDALMPRMDGRELCRRLKDEPATRQIRVIVMSALYRTRFHRDEAFKQFHVDEYLSKPVKPATLREAVERVMDEAATELSTEPAMASQEERP